jgi:hypothetical protein
LIEKAGTNGTTVVKATAFGTVTRYRTATHEWLYKKHQAKD